MPRPCPLCGEKYKDRLLDHVVETHPSVAWRVRNRKAYYNESLWCFCGFNCMYDDTMASHWRAHGGLAEHILEWRLK